MEIAHPVMDSFSQDGYILQDPGNYDVDYLWKAFRYGSVEPTDAWTSLYDPAYPLAVAQMEFPDSFALSQVIIQATGTTSDGSSLKTFDVEGSMDGSVWDILLSVVDETVFAPDEARTYPVVGSASYSHYRLNIIAGQAGDRTKIGDISYWKAELGGIKLSIGGELKHMVPKIMQGGVLKNVCMKVMQGGVLKNVSGC
ncbi:MAG: hypothetical protein DRH03_07125 [Deltaproteobacteria bacterium]|nr:MAG: hypothetical protein DRH03_07125 [Deltaproteobacteria bacterium]